MNSKRALVVGATGIVGRNLAEHLAGLGDWSVYGLSRNPEAAAGVQAVRADLLAPESVKAALQALAPTHIFLTTWMRQSTEAENIRVNGGIVRELLAVASAQHSVEHVALVSA